MGNAKEALKELLSEMEGFVSTKTVVGEAIHMDDIIILPLVDVSLGAGAGRARQREKRRGRRRRYGQAVAQRGVGA